MSEPLETDLPRAIVRGAERLLREPGRASWLGPLEDRPQPLVEHLIELRKRLIVSLLAWAAGAGVCYFFAPQLLSWLSRPAGSLVFTAPTEAFYTHLRVAAFGGVLLALPVLLHQAWLFVARALEPRWRRVILALVPVSYVLFLGGAALALWVVVPAAMRFLLSFGSSGVRPLMALGPYLEFLTSLCLAFGAVFQLPVVLYALNRAGAVSRARLSGLRPPLYLGFFVLAAMLTPGPDVVSQIALAFPAVALFELTLLFLD